MVCQDVLEAVGIYFCLYIFYSMTIPKKWKAKRTSSGSECMEVGGQGDKERRIKGKTKEEETYGELCSRIHEMEVKKVEKEKIEVTGKKGDKRKKINILLGRRGGMIEGEDQMERKKRRKQEKERKEEKEEEKYVKKEEKGRRNRSLKKVENSHNDL